MRKFIVPLLMFLFVICFPVFSQETETGNEPSADLNFHDDEIYVINSFVYEVDGITREFALTYVSELKEGEEITGLSNLENFIENKRQLLFNQRALASVRIEHTIGERREDGKRPVDLVIYVKDTWNLVAIPRPMYTSNNGFDITLKLRDYNFLGTLSPLRIDLAYKYDERERTFFTFMLRSDTPLRAFDLNWNFNFDNDFHYRPDMELPYYFRNVLGVSVEFPIRKTTLTVGFDEGFIYNEENSEGDWPVYGQFQEGLYLSSVPYISWKIPTGIVLGYYGDLTYTPRLSARFNHELPQWPLDKHRIGPFLGFSHNLGFGRVDWIGNFRRGYSANVGNSYSFNFYYAKNNIEPLSANYSVSGDAHFTITDFFGASSRLTFRHWINDYNDNAGDVLRGILDKDVKADYMLSLNLDLPVRVLRIRPSEWFSNQKFRILNFDLHLSPIIDLALYHDPLNNTSFSFENLLITGGLEIIVFPDFFRSTYLRISVGFDFSEFSIKNGYEIYMGTSLHF